MNGCGLPFEIIMFWSVLFITGQTGVDRQALVFQSLVWMFVLVLTVALAALLLWRIRSKLANRSRDQADALGLDNLRRLRDEGKLSQAEFENLRKHALGRH